MEDPDSGYTIDQHLPPTGAAAHELASAGHRWILIKLSLRETHQRQVEAHMRQLSAVCLQKVPRGAPRRAPEPDELVAVDPRFHPAGRDRARPNELRCERSDVSD
jgi:hypothetical protein